MPRVIFGRFCRYIESEIANDSHRHLTHFPSRYVAPLQFRKT